MNTKNQGYLIEFIANNGYDSNIYYECGYNEYKAILHHTNGQHEQALQVVELIEDGKHLEAVMVGMNF